ncbi:MAG: hypothetical protein LUI87_13920 [Lachnospiraceae bacterium]|nr:hypothetical protein [Lachnospiraceae bacterium]
MSDLTYRSFLLSEQEFMVLSAFTGIEKVHMLIEKQPDLPDRKELSLTIFGLYQKGLLHWENGTCGPKSEIRDLFCNIRSSQKELLVFHREENAPLLCYWADSSVLTELSENDRDKIKLHGLSKNDFLSEMKERGILPEKSSRLAEYDRVLTRENNKTLSMQAEKALQVENSMREYKALRREGPAISPMEDCMGSFSEEISAQFLCNCPELMKDGEIQYAHLRELFERENELETAITVHNRASGEDEGVILILDCGLYDGIVQVGDGGVRAEYYSQESLQELLA